jgi:hypothetical protein
MQRGLRRCQIELHDMAAVYSIRSLVRLPNEPYPSPLVYEGSANWIGAARAGHVSYRWLMLALRLRLSISDPKLGGFPITAKDGLGWVLLHLVRKCHSVIASMAIFRSCLTAATVCFSRSTKARKSSMSPASSPVRA